MSLHQFDYTRKYVVYVWIGCGSFLGHVCNKLSHLGLKTTEIPFLCNSGRGSRKIKISWGHISDLRKTLYLPSWLHSGSCIMALCITSNPLLSSHGFLPCMCSVFILIKIPGSFRSIGWDYNKIGIAFIQRHSV